VNGGGAERTERTPFALFPCYADLWNLWDGKTRPTDCFQRLIFSTTWVAFLVVATLTVVKRPVFALRPMDIVLLGISFSVWLDFDCCGRRLPPADLFL
jgi:hypothetical protein